MGTFLSRPALHIRPTLGYVRRMEPRRGVVYLLLYDWSDKDSVQAPIRDIPVHVYKQLRHGVWFTTQLIYDHDDCDTYPGGFLIDWEEFKVIDPPPSNTDGN